MNAKKIHYKVSLYTYIYIYEIVEGVYMLFHKAFYLQKCW